MLNVYKGLMRSVIEYNGSCIHIKNKSLRQKLDKIQYKAIRLALGYRNLTPINVMLSEAKEHPFNIRIDYLSNKMAIKLVSMEDDGLSNILCDLYIQSKNEHKLNTLASSFPIFRSYIYLFLNKNIIKKFQYPLPYPYDLPALTFSLDSIISMDHGIKIQKSKLPNSKFNDLFLKTNTDHIDFYTDGSKSESNNYCGVGIYCSKLNINKKIKINKQASIFTLCN